MRSERLLSLSLDVHVLSRLNLTATQLHNEPFQLQLDIILVYSMTDKTHLHPELVDRASTSDALK